MPLLKISEFIPDIYHRFLPDIFTMEIPQEYFTNCVQCPMIPSDDDMSQNSGEKPFSPSTKCCTFTPRIPNYMVGGILNDTSPEMEEGRSRILETLKSRRGVIPNGVYPTKKYKLLYDATCTESFGRSKKMLCPYYKTGLYNCTVWKYREAICGLWFCKHLAAQAGFFFWEAVTEYLKQVQEVLISYCAMQQQIDTVDFYENPNRLSYEEMEELPPNDRDYQQLWGNLVNREIDYYINCFKLIGELSPEMFKALTEFETTYFTDKIFTAYKKVVELPDILILNNEQIQHCEGDVYNVEFNNYIERINKIITYSVPFPKYLMDAFDGKTQTVIVLKNIYQNHNTLIEPEILIALYHHDILKAMP